MRPHRGKAGPGERVKGTGGSGPRLRSPIRHLIRAVARLVPTAGGWTSRRRTFASTGCTSPRPARVALRRLRPFPRRPSADRPCAHSANAAGIRAFGGLRTPSVASADTGDAQHGKSPRPDLKSSFPDAPAPRRGRVALASRTRLKKPHVKAILASSGASGGRSDWKVTWRSCGGPTIGGSTCRQAT